MDEPGSSVLISQLIFIFILILISAFCAAGKAAIASLNRSKLETEAKEGKKRSQKLLTILDNSTKYNSKIQVVKTVAGLFAAASVTIIFYERVARLFKNFIWNYELAVIIIIFVLAYFILLLSKFYPEQIGIHRPKETLGIVMPVIKIFGVIFRPFVTLLEASTKLLLKITPIDFHRKEDTVSRTEVMSILEKSKLAGNIDDEEFEMLEGIISFNDKMVREVMVPRTDTFMIDINDKSTENIDKILNEPFSRIPVYGGDKDTVIGVIHIKDVLKSARKIGFEKTNLPEIMVEPIFVSETTNVNDLLFKMKNTHQQMAIILDEYGGVVGIATIEDLIEEIVGEIDDEYDESTKLYHRLTNNSYKIEGKLSLNDFNRLFDENLEIDDVDTIAGYLISQIGEIPTNNNEISYVLPDGTKLISGTVKSSRIQDIIVEFPLEKAKSVMLKLTKKRDN